MLASARRRAWRMAGVCGLAPVYGRNVGRAISPAAGALRHRRVSGTMRASSPTGAGQGPAGPCRIFPPLTGNAPLRLRLAAHPPPLAGEALEGLPPGSLPCKGRCRPRRRRGAAPCLASILLGWHQARRRAWRMAGVCALLPARGRNVGRAISPAAGALRHRRVSGTMQASSPTGAGQGPAGPCRIFLPQTGNAPLRLRLAAHPPPLAGEALGGAAALRRGRCAARPPVLQFVPQKRQFVPGMCRGPFVVVW